MLEQQQARKRDWHRARRGERKMRLEWLHQRLKIVDDLLTQDLPRRAAQKLAELSAEYNDIAFHELVQYRDVIQAILDRRRSEPEDEYYSENEL